MKYQLDLDSHMVTKKTIKFRLIPPLPHECLLLKAQGTGPRHPVEQGDQDGSPAVYHRLHLDLQTDLPGLFTP